MADLGMTLGPMLDTPEETCELVSMSTVARHANGMLRAIRETLAAAVAASAWRPSSRPTLLAPRRTVAATKLQCSPLDLFFSLLSFFGVQDFDALLRQHEQTMILDHEMSTVTHACNQSYALYKVPMMMKSVGQKFH